MPNFDNMQPDSLELLAMFETAAAQATAAYAEERDSLELAFNKAASAATVEHIMTNLSQFDRKRHGGLYDRGGADAYYNRPPSAHWYPEGTGRGKCVTDLTKEEILEYYAGYNDGVESGCFKEY
jgi:hypothetical protein